MHQLTQIIIQIVSTFVNRFIDYEPRHIQQIRLQNIKPDTCGKLTAGKSITLVKCLKTLNFLIQLTLSSSYAPQWHTLWMNVTQTTMNTTYKCTGNTGAY